MACYPLLRSPDCTYLGHGVKYIGSSPEQAQGAHTSRPFWPNNHLLPLARHCCSVAVSRRLTFTRMVTMNILLLTDRTLVQTVAAFYSTRCVSNCISYRHCLPPFSLRICIDIIHIASYTRVEYYGVNIIFFWDIHVCQQRKARMPAEKVKLLCHVP